MLGLLWSASRLSAPSRSAFYQKAKTLPPMGSRARRERTPRSWQVRPTWPCLLADYSVRLIRRPGTVLVADWVWNGEGRSGKEGKTEAKEPQFSPSGQSMGLHTQSHTTGRSSIPASGSQQSPLWLPPATPWPRSIFVAILVDGGMAIYLAGRGLYEEM